MKCEFCEGSGIRYYSNFGGDRTPDKCNVCYGEGRIFTPAERLIVAADFKPKPEECIPYGLARNSVRRQVLALADSLKGTGVYLKVNSALRACGYDLIGEIQSRGLRVFADLKLYDIPNTLTDDGILLRETNPGLVTVVCSAGVPAMQALKAEAGYRSARGDGPHKPQGP